MAAFQYKCKSCGLEGLLYGDIGQDPPRPESVCPDCGANDWGRVYSLSVHRPMADHWNNTTGQVVGSMREFKEQLKRKSEEATLKSGIEHNYEPIDYSDFAHVIEASDAQGLDDTNRARAREGKRLIDL